MAEGKIVSGVGIISVGYDYLKLTGFKLLEGRDFSKALEIGYIRVYHSQ